jgi:hypothetical protein
MAREHRSRKHGSRKHKVRKVRASQFIDVPREVYYARPDLLLHVVKHVKARDLFTLAFQAWRVFKDSTQAERFRADAIAAVVFLGTQAKFPERSEFALMCSTGYYGRVDARQSPWLHTLQQDAVRQLTSTLRLMYAWEWLDWIQVEFDAHPNPGLLRPCPDLSVSSPGCRAMLVPSIRRLRARELGRAH